MDDLIRTPAIGASAGVLAALAVLIVSVHSSRSRRALPPGPRGVPLLGNALQIPTEYAWLQFAKWGEQYGDVVYLNALGQHIIVLNSPEAIQDLLIKRGSNYSDRPILQMAALSGWGRLFGLLPYGQKHQTTRKYCNRVLNIAACRDHAPLLEHSAQRFIEKLNEDNSSLVKSADWMAARTILKIVYNHEVADKGVDPVVHLVESALESFAAAISPGWLVDVAPSLRFLPDWLPGTGFLRQARIWRKGVDAMFDVPFDAVVADLQTNGATPNGSLAATLLSSKDGKSLSAEDTEIIRSAAGSLFLAGAEPISAGLKSMFLAMLLYPETQRRAQEEIESVTGGTRLPTAQDRDALPYLNSLTSEVHRWNPVSPIGLPHKSLNEDVYRDWRIPAGTTVMTNIWLLTHDPKVYRDPGTFNPDRYLVDGEPVPEPAIFGFGRRECPGQYLADASIWLGIAYTLATFNIVYAKDAQGHPIVPKAEYSGGGLSGAKDFPYALEIRSEHAAAWLRGKEV